MVISSKGKYMAVVNCGQSIQSIQLFDPKTLQQFDSVVIARAGMDLHSLLMKKNYTLQVVMDRRI
jgi:hypothetical protein